MGMVPRITCRRCGRQFSGLRSRCPYCGTRRVKQSDRAPGTTSELNVDSAAAQRAGVNTKWQLVFGVILLAAVILAVIVLVSVSLNDSAAKATPTPPQLSLTPTAEPTPTPTPTPTPAVTAISITTTYDSPLTDFTIDRNSTFQMKTTPYPIEYDYTGAIHWSSSDDAVATVDDTGLITAIGKGMVTLTVECYGFTASCVVHVR